jgi:hypothetical protein
MIEALAKLFAEYGGLIGLVVLLLFGLVAYLIREQTRLTRNLLQVVRENDDRLIDLKRALWKSDGLPLPDRRNQKR